MFLFLYLLRLVCKKNVIGYKKKILRRAQACEIAKMNVVVLRSETPDSPRPHNRTPGDPCRNASRAAETSRTRNYPERLLGKTSQKGLTRMRVWRFRVACTARVVCAGHTVPSQKRHDDQLEQTTSPAVTGRDKQHPRGTHATRSN